MLGTYLFCVCVCTENPDIPNSKQGNYFPINVKFLSIPLRAHAGTVTTLTVSSLLCSLLYYLFLAEKENKSIGSQFWIFWFTLRNLISLPFCVFFFSVGNVYLWNIKNLLKESEILGFGIRNKAQRIQNHI